MQPAKFQALAILAIAMVFGLTACEPTTTTNENMANRNAANVNNNRNTNESAEADDDDYDTPDGLITAKTKLSLMADQNVSAFDVDVDTVDGKVTLSGKVDDEAAKTAAANVAKGIEGVREVNNVLTVVPESKREVVDEQDDVIEASIQKALDEDADMKDLDLTAKVNAGVVTLNGSVAQMGELVRTAEAIRDLKGVKRVVTSAVKVEPGTGNRNSNANDNRT